MNIVNFDVMDAMGIPNIPGFSPSVTDALIGFGGAMLINLLFGHYWGIFDQHGFPVLLVDNVTSIDYQQSSAVATAPLENGTFAAYNKVVNPRRITVQLTKGSGGVVERGLLMAMLEALAGSTNKFTIITPEAIYPNYTIDGYAYARSANDGARLIKANVSFTEVRSVTLDYQNVDDQDTGAAKNPEAQNPSNGGQKTSPPVNTSGGAMVGIRIGQGG